MEFPPVRYILGFISFIALIILGIVLIARVSNRGDNTIELAPTINLVEAVDSNADFVFTEQGPIVANEDHYQIRITVNRNNRRVEYIKGYEGTVVSQINLDNNEESFRQFLSAIDRVGFDTTRETKFDSEAGLCPRGRRYILESEQADNSFRRWTTSCNKQLGDFGGNLNSVASLFRKQIPNYTKFVSQGRRTKLPTTMEPVVLN